MNQKIIHLKHHSLIMNLRDEAISIDDRMIDYIKYTPGGTGFFVCKWRGACYIKAISGCISFLSKGMAPKNGTSDA